MYHILWFFKCIKNILYKLKLIKSSQFYKGIFLNSAFWKMIPLVSGCNWVYLNVFLIYSKFYKKYYSYFNLYELKLITSN